MAEMIRRVRWRTGTTLRAAMTLTVTSENPPELPAVIRWCVDNADAFGLVSLQPLARVGRTDESLRGVSTAELWERIAAPAVSPAPRTPRATAVGGCAVSGLPGALD